MLAGSVQYQCHTILIAPLLIAPLLIAPVLIAPNYTPQGLHKILHKILAFSAICVTL